MADELSHVNPLCQVGQPVKDCGYKDKQYKIESTTTPKTH